MFHRAVKEGPQSRAPPAKSLEKYLFPSSSPSTRNGDIVDGFNKATVKPRQAGASASAALTASPPKTRPSAHAGQPSAAQRSYSTYNPKSFESLYNKVGSFDDVEVVVPATNGKVLHDVFFSPDDFSDDENLDLEYSCPNNILPAALKEPPKTAAADGNTISQLSWSSSPASHVLPAPPPPAAQPVPVKRASPTPTGESPVAKKRRLPKNWLMSKEEEKPAPAAATPQGKAQGQLWNMTASAVKEQKRQLKEKSRKPAASETPETFQPTYQAPVLKREVFSSAITLSKEQRRIQDLVVNRGLSIFFTGPAGTGKSVLMRSIIEALRKKYAREPERLSITASTGLAACNIGGMTLHSFAGIGLGKEDTQQLVTKIRRNPKAKNRWLKTKTLIIDEISMVDGELFDKLSQIGRIIRNNGRPWGGIQLVITGDFFQLPPVPEGDKREAKFAFDAATWSTSIDHTIGLTEVFRQKDPGE